MQERENTKTFEQWLDVHKVKEERPKLDITDRIVSQTNEYQRKSFIPEPNEKYIKWENARKEREAFVNSKNESLTEGVLQIHFYEKLYFPLCPEASAEVNLDEYAERLEEGKVIARSENGKEYIIESIGWSLKWDFIQVEIKKQDKWDIPFCIHISIEEGKYLHSKGKFEAYLRFCDSPNVLQCGAKTQCYFPLCPKEGNISLEEYAELMQKDALFEKNQYSDGYIIDREITQYDNGIPYIYVGVKMPDSYKEYSDVIIFVEHGKVIHQIGHTYSDKRYLEREFCKIRGQEWNDDEVIIDDYC